MAAPEYSAYVELSTEPNSIEPPAAVFDRLPDATCLATNIFASAPVEDTDKSVAGELVPMPTLPDESTVIRTVLLDAI